MHIFTLIWIKDYVISTAYTYVIDSIHIEYISTYELDAKFIMSRQTMKQDEKQRNTKINQNK